MRRLADLPAVLTADEVAEVLRISLWAVYERVKADELPALRLGRSLRFSRDAILALLDENGSGPAAGTAGPEGFDASGRPDHGTSPRQPD